MDRFNYNQTPVSASYFIPLMLIILPAIPESLVVASLWGLLAVRSTSEAAYYMALKDITSVIVAIPFTQSTQVSPSSINSGT